LVVADFRIACKNTIPDVELFDVSGRDACWQLGYKLVRNGSDWGRGQVTVLLGIAGGLEEAERQGEAGGGAGPGGGADGLLPEREGSFGDHDGSSLRLL
jgi:hypothetical protein